MAGLGLVGVITGLGWALLVGAGEVVCVCVCVCVCVWAWMWEAVWEIERKWESFVSKTLCEKWNFCVGNENVSGKIFLENFVRERKKNLGGNLLPNTSVLYLFIFAAQLPNSSYLYLERWTSNSIWLVCPWQVTTSLHSCEVLKFNGVFIQLFEIFYHLSNW